MEKLSAIYIDKMRFIVYNIFCSINFISGCRVTVTHQFWELAQAGSTPVIPTKKPTAHAVGFYVCYEVDFCKLTEILLLNV